MQGSISSLSTSEAAKMAGCSLRKIQTLIKQGKLSASRDDAGCYTIDKSEFFRVFPDAHNARLCAHTDANYARTSAHTSAKPTETLTHSDAHYARTSAHDDAQWRITLESEVRHLKEMLAEKNRQNDFLHKQLEVTATEKTMLIETLTSNQKLLEHTSTKKRKKLLGIF